MVSIATLERISAENLAKVILAGGTEAERMAIIDVRDEDYIGGHIKGTINVPSLSFSAPQLVERLRDKETVVFHCALSQQRGPGAALRYLREKERQEAEQAAKAEKEEKRESKEESEAGSDGSRQAVPQKKQRVLVLDQGFVAWQRAYGEDERLTEGYSRALWADYMD